MASNPASKVSRATRSNDPSALLGPTSEEGSVNDAHAHEGIVGKSFCKVKQTLGFQKNYNVPLWFIFGGAMIGFVLARLGYLNLDVGFRASAAPGEYYWVKQKVYRAGMLLHLSCILPCGFLSVFQFLPIIRHKLIILHRVNGYLVLLLLVGGVTGALIITRHAFGGDVSTQTASGTLSFATLVSAILAYYNIKRLQLDQHRKWMLRTMFYMATIITVRLIMGIGMMVIAKMGTYSTIWDCVQLMDTVSHKNIAEYYPSCLENSSNKVIVPASFDAVETIGSALRISFGLGLWLGFFIHALGIEIYIRLTPAESERLRMVSYERQVEAGLTPAGSAGTTSDRFGDAKWKPMSTIDIEEEDH